MTGAKQRWNFLIACPTAQLHRPTLVEEPVASLIETVGFQPLSRLLNI